MEEDDSSGFDSADHLIPLESDTEVKDSDDEYVPSGIDDDDGDDDDYIESGDEEEEEDDHNHNGSKRNKRKKGKNKGSRYTAKGTRVRRRGITKQYLGKRKLPKGHHCGDCFICGGKGKEWIQHTAECQGCGNFVHLWCEPTFAHQQRPTFDHVPFDCTLTHHLKCKKALERDYYCCACRSDQWVELEQEYKKYSGEIVTAYKVHYDQDSKIINLQKRHKELRKYGRKIIQYNHQRNK